MFQFIRDKPIITLVTIIITSNHDADYYSSMSGVAYEDPARVRPSVTDICDVNTILIH